MLVLSRKENESIIIGDGPDAIEVSIVHIKGNNVRIGIVAPCATAVDRAEVRWAKEQEHRLPKAK